MYLAPITNGNNFPTNPFSLLSEEFRGHQNMRLIQYNSNIHHVNQYRPKVYRQNVLTDDGFHKIETVERVRNSKKNIIPTPANMTGSPNAICLNISNVGNVWMCRDYYKFITMPVHLRKQQPKPKCTHSYDDLGQQHLPLCYFYTKDNCKNGDNCDLIHADVVNVNQPQLIIKYSNWKTSLCLPYLHKLYNKSSRNCSYNHNCKHAHSIKTLNTNSTLEQFDTNIKINPNKNLLQEIYNEVYRVVINNKDDIIKLYLKNNKDKPYFSDPIPEYFCEYLEILSYSLYLSSKEANTELYNKLNIQNINFVQGLLRRMKYCKTDVNLHTKLCLGHNGKIMKEDICIHFKTCNSGVHIPLNDDLSPNYNVFASIICKNELGGNCTCQHNNIDLTRMKLTNQIDELKKEEKTLIDQLKFNSLAENENRLKRVKETIENKLREFLTTFNKIHLVKDYGYKQLHQVELDIEKENKEFDEDEFEEMDTKLMTHEELGEYNIKLQKRHDNIQKISKEVANNLKLKKETQEKEDLEKHANAIKLYQDNKDDMMIEEWYLSGAWSHMSYSEYHVNKEIYTHWKKNSLGCDFSRFKQHVNRQLEKWEDADDHFKERYHNIWSYMYNITIENDTDIIGNLKDIIESSPEIWHEYKHKYAPTNYSKTFPEYINENEILEKALKLNKMYPDFGYNKAHKYIRLNINNLTFNEYCTHDNHTVVMWNEINLICKRYQMTQYKIEDFITNKTNLIEFYKYGIKYYGTTQESFNRFIQEKADGWKINIKPAKLNEYSSLLALSLDQLKEFFQKNNVWSIEMMTKFRTYVPSIVYTVNNKAHMYTIFTSIVDNQIKELYKLLISPEITKILNNNGEINKANTDLIAIIKVLLNEINNSHDMLNKLCGEYKDRASELRLLKTAFDTNSELLVLANKVLDIFKNIKGKRELTNLKIKKITKKEESDSESDDSESDDSESDDSESDDSESEDDNINILTKNIKPNGLYELMPLGYDYKIYIRNEHPNDMSIDKTSSGRKIFFGPFIDTELDKNVDTNKSWIKELIKILQESKFGKGSNLGAKFLKLEDPSNNKLPSWHIVLNDKKITSKSNRYKEKCERQDKTEDEYGYDWVADLFINIINKKLNYTIDQILTNIFTLEARMQDHINRNNRAGIAKVVKQIIIKEKQKFKTVLTKEEKTQLIRDKLAAKAATKNL
jgi:hypothetical protein